MPSDPEPPREEVIFPAVTPERIISYLEKSGWNYFRDSDGDVGIVFNSIVCYFFLQDTDQPIMQARARWHRSASIARIGNLLQVCNEWNLGRTWPKAYVRVSDSGEVIVFAESSFDVFDGSYDAQLSEWIDVGIRLALAFFSHLDEHFPDPLASEA